VRQVALKDYENFRYTCEYILRDKDELSPKKLKWHGGRGRSRGRDCGNLTGSEVAAITGEGEANHQCTTHEFNDVPAGMQRAFTSECMDRCTNIRSCRRAATPPVASARDLSPQNRRPNSSPTPFANHRNRPFFAVLSKPLRSSEFEPPQQSQKIRVSFLMNRTPT